MPGSKETFKKYINSIFIETGSGSGAGIEQAINAGFKYIYSIELHKEPFDYCVNRFKDNPNVHLMYGDSGDIMDNLLSEINEPATFWLDGHDEDAYPIIKELQAIGRHFIKTHIIMIDDLRMFDVKKHGLNLEIIKSECIKINPSYKFYFENGHVINDILVIKI